MKKVIGFLCVLSVPLLMFFSAWQAYSYQALENEVGRLQDTQDEWLEQNRRSITEIAVETAPGRVDRAARLLGLDRVTPSGVLEVTLERSVVEAQDGSNG